MRLLAQAGSSRRPGGVHVAVLPAVLVVGLLLLPAVGAVHIPGHALQPMQVSVENPRGLFSPLGQFAELPLTVSMDCTLAQADTPINFTVREKPDWLFIQNMPGWRTDRNAYTGYSNLDCDQQTGTVTIRERMVANFTTYAPAYRFANFTVQVTRGNDIKQAVGYLQPGYFGVLEVVAPQKVARTSTQETKLDLQYRVRNFGNGETTVKFIYSHPAGVRVVAPDVMIVGANPQGGEWDKPLNVRLFLDDVREDFSVTVNATGFSRNASDPRAASPDEAVGTVDVQRAVPGPVWGALAAVAAAVALLGSRRSGRSR